MDFESIDSLGIEQEVKDVFDFKPQKTVAYNKFLPYYKDADNDATRMLSDIKAGLEQSILLHDLETGFGLWSNELDL